ncbi:MAG TPA: hypothetical protein VNL18_01370 [Gemmatimonadales bacterium]|nr:hypothetical protein [Gemmatimonadales bacterium]
MEDILAIVLIFGGGSAFLLAISPIGRAVADRIRSGPSVASDETLGRIQEAQQAILEDLESVRQELTDLQERMDFTERLLARHREVGLPPSGGAPKAENG